jgi:hypothetical protein
MFYFNRNVAWRNSADTVGATVDESDKEYLLILIGLGDEKRVLNFDEPIETIRVKRSMHKFFDNDKRIFPFGWITTKNGPVKACEYVRGTQDIIVLYRGRSIALVNLSAPENFAVFDDVADFDTSVEVSPSGERTISLIISHTDSVSYDVCTLDDDMKVTSTISKTTDASVFRVKFVFDGVKYVIGGRNGSSVRNSRTHELLNELKPSPIASLPAKVYQSVDALSVSEAYMPQRCILIKYTTKAYDIFNDDGLAIITCANYEERDPAKRAEK